MKFAIALLAFFGTLAIGQCKPTVSIFGDEFHQKFFIVYYSKTEEQEFIEYAPMIEDISELNSFCKNSVFWDGENLIPKIINKKDDDPRNVYFTCVDAEVTEDLLTPENSLDEATTSQPSNPTTNAEEIPTEKTEMDSSAAEEILPEYTQDESITSQPSSIPTTNTKDIATETKEMDNLGEIKPALLYPVDEQTFYYVSSDGDRVIESITIEQMSELTLYCDKQGGKRTLHIIEDFGDDDPHHVYFSCLLVDGNTDVVTAGSTPEDTSDETTTLQSRILTTEYIPIETTESDESAQNYNTFDPAAVKNFFYVLNYGKENEMAVSAPVDNMAELTAFCENRDYWEGEKRSVKIIERNYDHSNVYFLCESSKEDTDVPTTVPTTPYEPTTSTESTLTETTESVNSEATVAPYRYIGEGYEYHASVDAWMKLHVKAESWSDARLRCLHEGSTLASPIDPAMLEAMKGLLGGKLSVAFTGISADYAPGYFYSVEGVAIEDIPATFLPGEPDLTQYSDGCIGMYPNGTLTMLHCDTPKPFICYVKDSDVPEIQSPCGPDSDYVYESRTGKCYKFHTYGRTWSSAFMTCATEGGHLAIINSDKEAQAVVDLVNKFPESAVRSDYPGITLLGFRDWSEHRTWMTIHGQTLQKAGYSRWGPGEPSDPRSEFCGSMFRNGELNDTLCRSPMPFVCERKPAVPVKGTNSTSDSIALSSVNK